MRIPTALLSLCAFVFVFVSGAGPAGAQDDTLHYQAQVLRTSYGIPHVKAQDWGSLGYGYGYAFAQDNICVLAQDLLIATGTLSRFYGPGDAPDYRRLASDSVYKMVNSDARVSAAWASLDADMRDVMNGYAAGYNRYLRDTGVGGLSAACRDQPWVRPITGIDLLKVLRRFIVGTSTGLFVKALFSAAPPGPGDTAIQAPDAADAARLLESADLPDFSPEGFGSNGVALGSELTGGTGGLLGNPHFPWYGITRFYGVHLTIPGRYDVMGASVYGFPLVNIGFNRSLAWSHTVSTGRRFVFRELTLSKIDPTAYVYDGRTLPMTTEAVSVDVLQDDGTIQAVDHTFYMTRFGAVLVIPPILNWNRTTAYALTDVNLDNSRTFAEFREMGRARTIDEFSQVLRKYVGLPWVNTVAADSKGNAFYADMTVVPHVTNAQLADEDCKGSPITEPLAALRMFTLNGSRPKCDPGTDADAPVAGIFGPGNLPSLVRRDYVQNSNMSYWLTNPDAPLEGYSRLIGDDENRPQNFRTRLGITQIRDRMAGADGLPGTGFDRQWMQDVLFENRHYSAEIMLDDVLTLCATEDPIVIVDGTPVNVTEACRVLKEWDRRNKTASVGPHVWTEFWKRAMTPPSTGLYEVPFDPADPVNTPRGAKLSDPLVRARLMHDLGATVKYFADNLIPLDREWGEVQFDIRNGEPIPIHGGSVASGVYNGIITSPLIKGLGYTQVLLGSSYIQAVTWTPRGPDARALVTYSQSTDPENPHYADQTKLFSSYGWVDMPFAEGDIRRDPNLTSMQLREKR